MTNCISTMDKFSRYKTIQFNVLHFVGKNQGILTMLIFLEKSINLEDEIMKKDVVKKFQEIAKNKGMALTQADVDVILDVLEETIGAIGDELEVGEREFVACVKVEKKLVKERTGVTQFKDRPNEEWTKPAYTEVKLSAKTSFKKQTQKEVE